MSQHGPSSTRFHALINAGLPHKEHALQYMNLQRYPRLESPRFACSTAKVHAAVHRGLLVRVRVRALISHHRPVKLLYLLASTSFSAAARLAAAGAAASFGAAGAPNLAGAGTARCARAA